MMVFESSTGLRDLLLRIRKSEQGAVDLLFSHCMERMRTLAHRLFLARGDLHHFEETDDLLQKSLIRLHGAVQKLKPDTTRAFMAIALQNLRWALRDLARDMRRRRKGIVSDELVKGKNTPQAPNGEPESLLEWEHFHGLVDQLPPEEKEVFDFIYYGGHSQEEVAEMLSVSTRTIKRRWRSARIMLGKALNGEWPALD